MCLLPSIALANCPACWPACTMFCIPKHQAEANTHPAIHVAAQIVAILPWFLLIWVFPDWNLCPINLSPLGISSNHLSIVLAAFLPLGFSEPSLAFLFCVRFLKEPPAASALSSKLPTSCAHNLFPLYRLVMASPESSSTFC